MKAITFEMMPEILSNILEYQKTLQQQLEVLQRTIDERPKATQKELLTIEETCTLLGINRSTLYRWEKDGVVLSYGLEKRRYYKYSEITNILKPLTGKMS